LFLNADWTQEGEEKMSRRILSGALRLVLMLGFVLLLSGTVGAVAPSHTVDSNVVQYNEQGEGAPVIDKTAELIDGRECRVTLTITGKSSQKPVDVMLVIDRSGSMNDGGGSPPEPMRTVKNAAKSFIDLLGGNDRVGLVDYATTAKLSKGLTDNHGAVQTAIDGLVASDGGKTNISDAINKATQELITNSRAGATRVLIVFSDGVANRSGPEGSIISCGEYPCTTNACTDAAINEAKTAKDRGYTVFSVFLINIGAADSGCTIEQVEQLGKNTMLAIAMRPDYFYSTASESDLEAIYAEIAGEINPAFTDVVVTDKISDCFGEPRNISTSKGSASYDAGNRTITWSAGELGENTETLTYDVTAVPGCSGCVPVNENALINYKDEMGNPGQKTFPNPEVCLPPPTPTPTPAPEPTPTPTPEPTLAPYVGPVLVGIGVEPANATIVVGGTQQFTAKARYSDNSYILVTGWASWISSDLDVATIGTDGLATGVGIGSAEITATYNGLSDSATLNVTAPSPVPVSVVVKPESATIALGHTQQFTATAYYEGGSSDDVTTLASWLSSDPGVATVDASGLATSVAIGNTSITATLNGITSDPALLTVGPPAVESIEIVDGDGTTVECGEDLRVIAHYSDGSTADITDQVTWTSTDTGVAAVDENGVVICVGAGTAEITATMNGATDSVTVTVTPTPTPTPTPEGSGTVSVPWSLIGGIIGGAIAAALLLFFLLGRRKKAEPEEPA
jgi:hypothetical protein